MQRKKRLVLIGVLFVVGIMLLVACAETEKTTPYKSMWKDKKTSSSDEKKKESPTPLPTAKQKVQSKAVGTWIPYAIDYDGKKKQIKSIKKKIIEQVAKEDDNPAQARQVLKDAFKDLEDFQIKFKDNGIFVCESKGNKIEGTWKESNGAVIATSQNGNIEFQLKDNELSIGSVGQGTYLKKKKK